MKTILKFDKWKNTKQGYAIFAILELVMAYAIGSRALDTGSWWQYAFPLLLLVGGLQNLVRLIRKK